MLITVSQSATIHNDANDNFRSVIQKTTTVLRTDVTKKVWHQGDLFDTSAKSDYRMESNKGFDRYQEAPPGIVMPKFHYVSKKSIYPQTPDRLLQKAESTT